MTRPCSHLDEFFDGELSAADAATFRAHLAGCEHCQRQLRGRMQEALVVDEGSEPVGVIPIVRGRGRRFAILGALVAVAAGAALVWTWPRGTKQPPQVADLGVSLTIEKGATVMRGSSAHVGDRVHVRAHGPLWIYRGDHELVLVCPGRPGCHDGGADLDLAAAGTYQFVSLGTTSVVPTGHFDTDLAAVAGADVAYKIEALEVQ